MIHFKAIFAYKFVPFRTMVRCFFTSIFSISFLVSIFSTSTNNIGTLSQGSYSSYEDSPVESGFAISIFRL